MLKKIIFIILLVLLTACNVETNEDSDILDDINIIKPSEKLFWGREDNVLYISATKTEHSVNENTSVLNSKDINKEDVPWYINSWEKYSYTIEKVIIEKTGIPITPTSMRYWFANMKDLKEIEGLENIDTSLVTDMSYLFDECYELTSLNLCKFNTINVKDMSYMFSSCCSLKQLDLSFFDTSSVIDMEGMFSYLYSNNMDFLDLTSFDTSMVTNMHSMFSHSTINSLNISSFDTSNVVDMSYMFSWFESDRLDLSNFNTSNVEDMYLMFEWADIKELNISSFDTSNVKNIRGMFGSPNEYMRTIDVSHFDLSNAEDITTINDLFIETLP